MAQFEGKLEVRNVNLGSKSEGTTAWLSQPDGSRRRLYRDGVYEVGDAWFAPFDGLRVVVEGEAEADDYIRVTDVVRAPEATETPEPEPSTQPEEDNHQTENNE